MSVWRRKCCTCSAELDLDNWHIPENHWENSDARQEFCAKLEQWRECESCTVAKCPDCIRLDQECFGEFVKDFHRCTVCHVYVCWLCAKIEFNISSVCNTCFEEDMSPFGVAAEPFVKIPK